MRLSALALAPMAFDGQLQKLDLPLTIGDFQLHRGDQGAQLNRPIRFVCSQVVRPVLPFMVAHILPAIDPKSTRIATPLFALRHSADSTACLPNRPILPHIFAKD